MTTVWQRPWMRAAVAAGAVAIAVVGWSAWSPGLDPALVASVTRGPLTARVTTSGTLRPVQALTYRSPVQGREVEVVELVAEGAHVAEGELVARLDTTDIEREIERAEQEQRQAQLDLDVASAELDEARATLASVTSGEGALTVAEMRTRLQLAERKAERLRREYDALSPLLARGVITADELGRTASAYEQAEEELGLARKRAEVLEGMTRPRELMRAELQRAQKDAQLGRARSRAEEADARVAQLTQLIDACTLHAQRAGLVVYEEYLNASPRRKIRIGDRVTSSQGLVTIPEVARMIVEASVSEAEVHRVKPGQPADVYVEALGGRRVNGTVTRVGTLAGTSIGRSLDDKRFDLVIALDAADADVRPEMTARADITVAVRDDAVLVPVIAVFDDGGRFVAYVANGRSYETRTVTLGDANDQLVEVRSGLQPGERVLLVDPRRGRGRAAGVEEAGRGPAPR